MTNKFDPNDPNYKGFDPATEDIYIEIAANAIVGTWASNVKSIVTPSVRLAGLLNVSDTEDNFVRIIQLSIHGIISSLGSLTYAQILKLKSRTGLHKPRVKIRASATISDAITGKHHPHASPKQKAKLFELLAQFDVTFEIVAYDPKARDFVTSRLNRFARAALIDGNEGTLIKEREYRPQAVSMVESRESPTTFPPHATKLVPLTPNGFFKGN
jgi:hypothetical protein